MIFLSLPPLAALAVNLGLGLQPPVLEVEANSAPQSNPQPGDPAPAFEADAPSQTPASAVDAPTPAIAKAEPSTPHQAAKEPANGPVIELAPEEEQAAPPQAIASTGNGAVSWGLKAPDDDPLLYGLAPERRRATSTVIGGYGQFNFSAVRTGPAADNDFVSRANLRRMVLFVAQDIGEKVELYTELEWENAMACQTCQGAVEIEQAVLDWKLIKDNLTLRTGLIIVPMGVINQWHEPPIYNGVDRPTFDQVIIPSTWRELGIGATGSFAKYFRYETYVMTALNPTAFGPDGFMGARTHGSLARANAPAFVARVEAEPVLGAVIGTSGYFSDVGPNAEFYSLSGRKKKLYAPVFGYDVDARIKRRGFEGRIIWSQFMMPESAALLKTRKFDGSAWFPNSQPQDGASRAENAIPLRTQGGYVEVGYDVLRPIFHTSHELVPFVRAEYYDTQAKIPAGYKRRRDLSVTELTMGLSYRPIRNLVFKFDVQLRDRLRGNDSLLINAGTGFMM
jgi:hypothetical protein